MPGKSNVVLFFTTLCDSCPRVLRASIGGIPFILYISTNCFTQTVVEVLFTNGKSTLQEIHRAARLPERTVSEALTVLIQHNFVRFATLDEGPIARAYYECFFEDVYPLLRYGLEVQMVGKHTGSAEVSMFYYYFS